jgi:hypothetical protein
VDDEQRRARDCHRLAGVVVEARKEVRRDDGLAVVEIRAGASSPTSPQSLVVSSTVGSANPAGGSLSTGSTTVSPVPSRSVSRVDCWSRMARGNRRRVPSSSTATA